jgi:hypothetical protein
MINLAVNKKHKNVNYQYVHIVWALPQKDCLQLVPQKGFRQNLTFFPLHNHNQRQ